MIQVELDELGPPVELPLTPGQGRALAASGVVSAIPSAFRSGFWLIGPASKVGASQVGDMAIDIRPKVSIARLLFLAGYSQHAAAWRSETVPVAEATDLIPAVAQTRSCAPHASGCSPFPGSMASRSACSGACCGTLAR